MNIKRIIRYFFLHLQHLPMNSVGIRPLLCKWGGVKIKSPRHTFIGEDVCFDTLYPEKILIEQGVVITTGTLILSHFVLSPKPNNKDIAVHIKEYAFIGAHTIICKPVTIGRGAIIGAGSVITKDVPDNEIWAGNPARLIRKRPDPK